VNKKVLVNELRHGMFVADLDRPWLDTPFLLQGFLIDSDDQLVELRHYCKFVYVDPQKSVGAAYEAPMPSAPKQQQQQPARQSAALIRKVAAPPPLTETSKSSLIGDIKAILKESFTAKQEQAHTDATRDDAEREAILFFPVDDGPIGSGKNTKAKAATSRGTSQAARAEHRDEPLVIREDSGRSGLLRQLVGIFRGPAPAEKGSPPRENTNIKQLDERLEVVVYEDQATVEDEMDRAKQSHERAQEVIKDIVSNIHKERPLDVDRVAEAVNGMVESIVRNPDALVWLTRLRDRDSHAYGHAIDVSIYLIAFGRHLGFPKEQLNHLGIAGLLQDVGKIRVPQELLSKQGMLTPDQFAVVKQHVNYSLDILNGSGHVHMDVLETVAQHHERLDGSGYPHRLSGDDISLFGAMAGIADCFQALISERPYASAVSAHQALKDLYSWRNHQFNGTLIEQFIQCLGIFPVSSLVELNTGDVAVVIGQNKVRRLKPKVLLILDPDKKPYSNPGILDLINDPIAFGDTPFEIRRALAPGTYGINPREYYL
jgi:HD-GYP domain-containing protein (c-di-GMP phosphodiesterase class II)